MTLARGTHFSLRGYILLSVMWREMARYAYTAVAGLVTLIVVVAAFGRLETTGETLIFALLVAIYSRVVSLGVAHSASLVTFVPEFRDRLDALRAAVGYDMTAHENNVAREQTDDAQRRARSIAVTSLMWSVTSTLLWLVSAFNVLTALLS